MAEEISHPSRYVKLTKEQAPTEDINPGELNLPIDVPQLHVPKCNECGQPLPESYQAPADEPWTTGVFECAQDPESWNMIEGGTAPYIEQLRGIQKITDRGAQQLSVDIEYLNNVLSAISMPTPFVLSTFHTCFSTPTDQLKDLLKSNSGNQLDLPTANLVCKMRGVRLD